MIIKKTLLLLVIFSQFCFAQSYNDYASEFFFGLEPSSQAEAMGKGSVADICNATAQYYNPALLGYLKGLNLTYSFSTPYYTLVDAKYNYVGVTYKINEKHSIGISFNNFNSGKKAKYTYNGTERESSFEDYDHTYLTASYSYELFSDLYIGTNLNFYMYSLPVNVYDDRPSDETVDKSYSTLLIDLGVVKKFSLSESDKTAHYFYLGGSLKNIFDTKLKIISSEIVLPSLLSFGPAYKYEYKNQETKIIEIYVDLEYKDLLNGEFFTSYRLGSHISFYELLNLYLGYYTRNRKVLGDNGKDQISSFTYGLGFNLPFKKIFNTDTPITISLNLALLNQVALVTDFDDWGNLTNIDINFNYKL